MASAGRPDFSPSQLILPKNSDGRSVSTTSTPQAPVFNKEFGVVAPSLRPPNAIMVKSIVTLHFGDSFSTLVARRLQAPQEPNQSRHEPSNVDAAKPAQ